jgi:pimeloyl-ACP methyl ester carboxylesterase
MPVAADIYYHAYQEGEKLPVVLLHGAGGSHLSWPSEIRRMTGYKVFALDLPGHGKSGGRGHQSIACYAEAVQAWLDNMGIPRAVLIGHSMGSAVAQELALKFPAQVLSLCLIGTAARLRVNPILIEETTHTTTFHNAVEKVIDWSFGSQTAEDLKTLVARRLGDTRPSVLHGDFLACDAFDASGRIAEIKQPCLIICGAEDKMTPTGNAYFLADTLQNAEIKIIAGAGHMAMIEKPIEVANAIKEFLGNIPY